MHSESRKAAGLKVRDDNDLHLTIWRWQNRAKVREIDRNDSPESKLLIPALGSPGQVNCVSSLARRSLGATCEPAIEHANQLKTCLILIPIRWIRFLFSNGLYRCKNLPSLRVHCWASTLIHIGRGKVAGSDPSESMKLNSGANRQLISRAINWARASNCSLPCPTWPSASCCMSGP